MRFYGFSHAEISNMGYQAAWEYYRAMSMIECREDMLQVHVSGFPHKKQNVQKTYAKKLEKGMVEFLEKDDQEKVTTEDVYYNLIRKLGSG